MDSTATLQQFRAAPEESALTPVRHTASGPSCAVIFVQRGLDMGAAFDVL
jgi:hypothetical protein